MFAYMKAGRLTRPVNKLLVHIRWMGCKIAVYDFVTPRESGVTVRKNLGTIDRKRRGRRSTRGGRKRRALTSAAPQTTDPSVPRGAVSDRIIYRRMRTFDYSRRIVDDIKQCGNAIARNRKVLNRAPSRPEYIDRYNDSRARLLKLTRKWRDLRAATHGEPSFAIEYAFALEVGDDIPFRGNITKVRSLVPYFRPAVEESVQAIPISAISNNSKDIKNSHWCTKCARLTVLRLCRICGAELAPPDRSKTRELKRDQPVRIVRAPSRDSSPERDEPRKGVLLLGPPGS